jgi:hypothetical protein
MADRQKYAVPPFALDHLIAQVEALKAADTCPSLRGKSETIYLADIDVDAARQRAVLLINLSDKAASDTVYSDPDTAQYRILPKVGNEGSDFSAHVVINLNATDHVYLTILEVTPGLASGKVTRFLTFLFKFCAKVNPVAFLQAHPNGAVDVHGLPVMVRTRHVASLAGHPSDAFLNDIEQGTLGLIELIDKRHENLPWDTVGRTREVARSVKLKPGPAAGTNLDRIRDAATRAFRDNYTEARIHFKTASKIGRSIVLETEHLNFAQESIFVKKEKLEGFVNPLPTSHEMIHQDIIGKMVRYL